jgi:hypothetical protein
MAAAVLAVGVVTFAAGYRMGSVPSPIAPSPVASARPGISVAPSATFAPSVTPASIPDFQPVNVSQRLRGAVSAAGVGGLTDTSLEAPPWVVCAVDAAPRCGPLVFATLDRAYNTIPIGRAGDEGDHAPQIWAALTPATVAGGHIILAAVLEEQVVGAILFRLDERSNAMMIDDPFTGVSSVDSRLLDPFDPDQRGIDFLDLGILEPGRYIVAAGGLSPTFLHGTPAVRPTLIPFESRSDVAALVVTAASP